MDGGSNHSSKIHKAGKPCGGRGGSFLRRGGIFQGERSLFQSMPEMQARMNDGQSRAAHSFQRESASWANVFTRTRGRLSVAEVVMLMFFPSSLKISVLKDSAIFSPMQARLIPCDECRCGTLSKIHFTP